MYNKTIYQEVNIAPDINGVKASHAQMPSNINFLQEV